MNKDLSRGMEGASQSKRDSGTKTNEDLSKCAFDREYLHTNVSNWK